MKTHGKSQARNTFINKFFQKNPFISSKLGERLFILSICVYIYPNGHQTLSSMCMSHTAYVSSVMPAAQELFVAYFVLTDF